MAEPQTFVEPLHMGVNNAEPPHMLQSGELQRGKNAHYLPGSRGIRQITGRAEFADDGLYDRVYGIFPLQFESIDPLVLIRDEEGWRWATAGETGAFTSEVTEPSDFPFRSVPKEVPGFVHAGGKFFILSGEDDRNYVIREEDVDLEAGTITAQPHGMKPVEKPVRLVAITALSTWGHGEGFHFYFVTEYDENSGEESAFLGDPTPTGQSITSALNVEIFFSLRQSNPNATHWRLYRAGPIDSLDEPHPILSAYSRVGEFTIGTPSAVDSSQGTLSSSTFETGFASTVITSTGWVSGSLAVNGSTSTFAYNNADDYDEPLVIDDFLGAGASNIDGDIAGLDFRVWGRATGTSAQVIADFVFYVSLDAGVTFERIGLFRFTSSLETGGDAYSAANQSPAFNQAGGAYIPGRELSEYEASMFNDTNLRVKIQPAGGSANAVIYISGVEVNVFFHGTSKNFGSILYPVVVTSGVPSSRNGLPPESTIGCTFLDSLCLAKGSSIHYSFPGQYGAFPEPYRVTIETKNNDEITALADMDEWMFVGMEYGIARVNDLPTSDSFTFNRAAVWKVISPGWNCAGKQSVITFQLKGEQKYCAFVSADRGLCITNGFTSWEATPHMDWDKTVNVSLASEFIIEDYPKYRQLILYCAAVGSSSLNARIIYHYQDTHIRRDRTLTWTGPCDIPEAWTMGLMRKGETTSHLFVEKGSGKVHVEDRGAPTAGDNVFLDVETREIYPRGIGDDARLARTLIGYSDVSGLSAGGTSLRLEETFYNANRKPVKGKVTDLAPSSDQGVMMRTRPTSAEGYSFRLRKLASDGTGLALHHITMKIVPEGEAGTP